MNLKIVVLLSGLVWACAGQAQTTVLDQNSEDSPAASQASGLQAAHLIEPGMSAADAISLLGRQPDGKTEIGAACGMLEVLTWGQEQTRVILSDGRVSSVTNSE